MTPTPTPFRFNRRQIDLVQTLVRDYALDPTTLPRLAAANRQLSTRALAGLAWGEKGEMPRRTRRHLSVAIAAELVDAFPALAPQEAQVRSALQGQYLLRVPEDGEETAMTPTFLEDLRHLGTLSRDDALPPSLDAADRSADMTEEEPRPASVPTRDDGGTAHPVATGTPAPGGRNLVGPILALILLVGGGSVFLVSNFTGPDKPKVKKEEPKEETKPLTTDKGVDKGGVDKGGVDKGVVKGDKGGDKGDKGGDKGGDKTGDKGGDKSPPVKEPALRAMKTFPKGGPITFPDLAARTQSAKDIWASAETKKLLKNAGVVEDRFTGMTWAIALASAGKLNGKWQGKMDHIQFADEDFDSFIYWSHKVGIAPSGTWVPKDAQIDLWVTHRQMVNTGSGQPYKSEGLIVTEEEARENREYFFLRFKIVPGDMYSLAKERFDQRMKQWKTAAGL